MPTINTTFPTENKIDEFPRNVGKKDKEVYGGVWDKNNGKPPDDRFYHVSYDKNGNPTEFYFKNNRYFVKTHKGYLNCAINDFYEEDENGNITSTTAESFRYYLNHYNESYYHYSLTDEDIYGKKD